MKKKAVCSCQKLITFLDHVSSNPRLHEIQFLISMRRLKKIQMEKLAFLAAALPVSLWHYESTDYHKEDETFIKW
jgi:hypothetical protein